MKTDNPYLLVKNIALLQKQAGVDAEVAELVTAYARLQADAGRELSFYDDESPIDISTVALVDRWLIRRNEGVDPRYLRFLLKYTRTMSSRGLPVIFGVDHLAKKRGMTTKMLRWISLNRGQFYKEFEIPKANGGARKISAPQGQLRTLQSWILQRVLCRGKPHKYATAFSPGSTIVNNARPHVGRAVVVRMDLKDFFPSITHRQVRKVFERFGYPYRVAVMLANLCTLDGRLPQGAPTSPALSNLVCLKMDRRFTGLKKKLGFRYSRYADDLIFSSDNPKFSSLIPLLKQVVQEEGYAVNEEKLKIMRKSQRQVVTGLVINQRVGLPREHMRKLRAVAYRLKTKGPESIELTSRNRPDSDPLYVFQGHASFVKMVMPDKASGLIENANEALA